MINIAIRATFYIFCCRNRTWDSQTYCNFDFFSPFYIFAFVLFCLFVFFFFIIQSQAEFVNCLYVARFTIVHSKAQTKFLLLLLHVLLLLLLLLLLLAIIPRARMGSEAEWAIDSEAMRERGIIVLVKSN